MGRVINPDGVGKERKLLTRAVVIALRELMSQPEWNDRTRDLAAFIALSLQAIAQTIERTVAPWEKRGYWLKADHFRLEWEWTARVAQDLKQAILTERWDEIAKNAAQVGEKLAKIEVPKRHKLGEPWAGAFEKLRESTP